jgi:hypothetical protein
MSFPSQVPVPPLPPESILVAALNEYKKNTGNDLQSHPLSAELQSCDSVGAISAILQRQVNTVETLRDGNRGVMKWVRSLVTILCSISATLGDGASLVRAGNLTSGLLRRTDITVRPFHTRNRSLLALAFSLRSVPCRSFIRASFKTKIW